MKLSFLIETQNVQLGLRGFVLLEEAIRISPKDAEKYKDYIAKWESTRYDEWFHGEERIFLPFEKDDGKVKEVKAPDDLVEFLKTWEYTITDYYNGLARKRNGKQDEKIGRVLNRIKTDSEKLLKSAETDSLKKAYTKSVQEAARLMKAFENDKSRGARKDKLVLVISRHPLDIAKMSEDRGWQDSSCMRMGTQQHRHVWCDINEGTLIAYLTKESDKHLEDPVSRVLIKPYINQENHKDIMLVNTRMVYGANPPGFMEAVDAWLNSVQKQKQGIFQLHPKLYHDHPGHGEGQGEGVGKVIANVDMKDPKQVAKISPRHAMQYALEQDYSEVSQEIINKIAESPEVALEYFEELMKEHDKSLVDMDDVILSSIGREPGRAMSALRVNPEDSVVFPDRVQKFLIRHPETAFFYLSELRRYDEPLPQSGHVLDVIEDSSNYSARALKFYIDANKGEEKHELPKQLVKSIEDDPQAIIDVIRSMDPNDTVPEHWVKKIAESPSASENYARDFFTMDDVPEIILKSIASSVPHTIQFMGRNGPPYPKIIDDAIRSNPELAYKYLSVKRLRTRTIDLVKDEAYVKEAIGRVEALKAIAGEQGVTGNPDVPGWFVDALVGHFGAADAYTRNFTNFDKIPKKLLPTLTAVQGWVMIWANKMGFDWFRKQDDLLDAYSKFEPHWNYMLAQDMKFKKVPKKILDRAREYKPEYAHETPVPEDATEA